MFKKVSLSLTALALVLASVACAAPTDASAAAEGTSDEAVGETQQALCVIPLSPPTAVARIQGMPRTVSSGGYSYGTGSCDHYAVGFNELSNTASKTAIAETSLPSELCSGSKVSLTVWKRTGGGAWVNAGSSSANTQVVPDHGCIGGASVSVGNATEVIVRAQVRAYESSGTFGQYTNRAVTVRLQ